MKAEEIKAGKTYRGGKLGRTRKVYYRTESSSETLGYVRWRSHKGTPSCSGLSLFARWAQSEVLDTPAEEERAG